MKLPSFKKPPVTEVAIGLQFKSEQLIKTVDLGLFWHQVKDEFPITDDQQPLDPIPDTPQKEGIQVELLSQPPLRRVWMLSESKDRLIQLQNDRFHFNWRRHDLAAPYPRFPGIFSDFKKQWECLSRWSKTTHIGALTPLRYELTYVNEIGKLNGYPNEGQGYEALSFLQKVHGSYLPSPTVMTGELVFRMPDGKGTLSVTAKQGLRKKDSSPVLLVQLTARGSAEKTEMYSWFELAREWIVVGFKELTTPAGHKEWELE